MRSAAMEIDAYLAQSQAYAECSAMNRRQHQRLLATMETLVESYDREFIEFQTRREMVADTFAVPRR